MDLQTLEKGDFSFAGNQFETSPARQMLLVEKPDWFDAAKGEGFADEAIEILKGGGTSRSKNACPIFAARWITGYPA